MSTIHTTLLRTKRACLAARRASSAVSALSTRAKNAALKTLEQMLRSFARAILAANARDFARLPAGYPHADRLRLTEDRIRALGQGVATVRRLPDPVGISLERRRVPSGLALERRTVPLGVVGVIYEARPNVTVEITSLALKSGNCVILRGGRDAWHTNAALVRVIHRALTRHGIPTAAVALLEPFNRASVAQLLRARGLIDVIIPRGSNRLINYVRSQASIPTIETGAGVCHTYVERSARLDWAARAVINAKTRRPSVCNALDTLVVDRSAAAPLFRRLAGPLGAAGVVIYADTASFRMLRTLYPERLLRHARPTHFGKEFLSLKMSVKVVPSWREGIAHVQRYTSGHSESIMTQSKRIAQAFQEQIDAAAVYVNTSTAFTDGFEFGLGAEIGISTQKLHARGPMALEALVTYKWLVQSRGAIRPR